MHKTPDAPQHCCENYIDTPRVGRLSPCIIAIFRIDVESCWFVHLFLWTGGGGRCLYIHCCTCVKKDATLYTYIPGFHRSVPHFSNTEGWRSWFKWAALETFDRYVFMVDEQSTPNSVRYHARQSCGGGGGGKCWVACTLRNLERREEH